MELARHNSSTFTFEKGKLEGYLKKFSQTPKFFVKNQHLRYFILDFKQAVLIIKHDRDSTEKDKVKRFLFRDIEAAYTRDYQKLDSNQGDFPYKFYLKTS